jgi:endonuclease G
MKSMTSFIAISFLVISAQTPSFAKTEAVIGDVPLAQNLNLPGSLPNMGQASEVLISRNQYVISYNRSRRSLNWAAWKLESSDIGHVGRSNVFNVDPDLQRYLSSKSEQAVTPADYKGSCFDRGHQVPSADRDDSIANNQETFLMSNMIPQTAYLNRVIWEHFEAYTRSLVSQGKKVYIVAGPIYDQNYGFIGAKKNIPVPSKDFKVVIVLDAHQGPGDINSQTQMIAVIMPNILANGKTPVQDPQELCSPKTITSAATNDWMKYKTTVGEIERVAGIKILNNIQ